MVSDSNCRNFTPIGLTDWPGMHKPFGIKAKDRLQYMYVIGKTGMGKSTLLQNMAISDMQQGNGIAVINPHGDLATNLLAYVPATRNDDTVYFDATNTISPIGFNPLYAIQEHRRSVVTSILIATFKRIWIDSWGPRLAYILRNTLLSLLESGREVTLLDIVPVLVNKDFREQIIYRLYSKQLISFWRDEFDKYPAALRTEAIAPILNKVGVFASNPILSGILGQKTSSIDLSAIMNNKKIMICNFSKGILGEDVSRLLGSIFVSMLHFTALERATMPIAARIPFYAYIDEMHSFVSLSFADILSEARKYGLSLFLAHQYLDQVPEEIRSAIFGNTGTIISFRVGAEDAAYLAKEFYPVFSQSDFINLPPYSMYIKLMIDGVASKPFSARTVNYSQQ